MKKLFIVLSLISLTACSSLASKLESGDFAANLAIQYATTKLIHSRDNPVATAVKIVKTAQDMKSFWGGGETVALKSVMSELRAEVPWGQLDPADTVLVSALLRAIEQRLNEQISGGLISPDAVSNVDTIADAIIDSASLAL